MWEFRAADAGSVGLGVLELWIYTAVDSWSARMHELL
jgi:hypothetical protein